MSIKQDLLDSFAHEVRVIQHLAGKLSESQLDFRPTPGQRSTLELLQYLSRSGVVGCEIAISQDWDRVKALSAEGKATTAASFAAEMNNQLKQIEGRLAEFSDADLIEKRGKTPWGDEMSLNRALVECGLKFLSNYRLQLFLYAKQSGSENLGTANAWGGRDPQPKS